MGGPRGVIRPEVHFPSRAPAPDAARDARDGASARGPDSRVGGAASRDASSSAPRARPSSSPPDRTPGASPPPAKKRKKDKRARSERLMAHLSLRAEATTPSASRAHPFDVDPADHCETPFQAYQDVEPFLFRVALALKKPKAKLRIYDPYFCEGSVKKHLARLGFESVYNEDEDFYAVAASGRCPDHDVVLTNPPYSGDHFRKILRFVGESGKPWLLLLPNFVCRKQYYEPAINPPPSGGIEDGGAPRSSPRQPPLFLIPDPLKPYRYWAPGRAGFEARGAAKGTTPFETFWYVHMGGVANHDEVRAWWLKKFAPHSTCRLPAPTEALPQQQRLQKRPNPRARKIRNEALRREGGGGGGDEKGGGGIYYDPERAKRDAKKRREEEGGEEEEGRGGGSAGGAGGRGKGKKRGRQREEGDKGKKKKKKK